MKNRECGRPRLEESDVIGPTLFIREMLLCDSHFARAISSECICSVFATEKLAWGKKERRNKAYFASGENLVAA